MEPPSKRRRIFTPLNYDFTQTFDHQHGYYETPISELDEEGGEDEDGPVFNPDEDLQQKRARLDYKLKSTFESIFEKYGKDFEGIGDEIDLYTGEILVDNGHLLEMENERDAGNPDRAGSIPTSATDEPEIMTSSVEDDGNEEDDDDEDIFSDEDMIDDDMILRGFAQASQFIHRASPEMDSFDMGFVESREEPRRKVVARPTVQGSALPSRSDILSQFGPQLGPEIVKFVSQNGVLDDTGVERAWRAPPISSPTAGRRVDMDIEPAWRAPFIPTTATARRSTNRLVTSQSEVERSPSPENSTSIWAPSSHRKRISFTTEEDEMLLEFVAKARRHGLDLSRHLTWKQMEATHPRHTWQAWKTRYKRKFTYLSDAQVEDSEISTSETSTGAPWVQDQHNVDRGSKLNFAHSSSIYPSRPGAPDRPTRVRKPAHRDSTILSWSEAVATIESVDPDLHAGLLQDVQGFRSDASFGFRKPRPLSQEPGSGVSYDKAGSRQNENRRNSTKGQSKLIGRPKESSEEEEEEEEDELALYNFAFQGERAEAPCPHADCRSLPSRTYRLGRYEDEDLSPMCLHLLRVHQTTPFPCAEFNCDRKGDRGYFMQEDLVRHVKQSHPYATALHRLRGRVDSVFLNQEFHLKRPIQSKEAPRPCTPGAQTRDSDFMTPQRHVSNRVQSKSQPRSSSSPQDRTLTPRGSAVLNRINSAGASSLIVNPSSGTDIGTQSRVHFQDIQYDSDVQILDSDPFLNTTTPLAERKRYQCPLGDSTGCEKVFATSAAASVHSRIHNSNKVSYTYATCDQTASASHADIAEHLNTHETQASKACALLETAAEPPQQLPPLTIPNSQSSSSEIVSIAATLIPGCNDATAKKAISGPLPHNTIDDPYYQFSDEDLDLPPPVQKTRPSPPKSPQAELPRTVMKSPIMPNVSSLIASRSPPNKQFLTPSTKAKPRKSLLHKISGSEELDELSLGTDDFVLLSSRPRTGFRPNSESQSRVKREESTLPNGDVQPTRKRKFSMVEALDELDELCTELHSLSRTSPLGPINTQATRVKEETDVTTAAAATFARSKQRRLKHLRGDKPRPALSQSQSTPVGHQDRPSGTNTPLIDLVGRERPIQKVLQETVAELSIPSTSQVGSSPTTRQNRTRAQRGAIGSSSPLVSLLTPAPKKRQSGNFLKQEEEDGVVETPGGTLRRCGQDGFTCRRAFCFVCGSATAGH